MASGSSKGFDFASDDILRSYEDYTNQDNSNDGHSDSAIGNNSAKEFHKNRMARSSAFPDSSYSPPDDSGNQDVIISAVERSMKKYADNLMRFLEGLSSRLSQLELYCYNLDKSIGEMRSDLARDHGESDAKLRFLEKQLQEVNRSVQILRDKQELADTQKELAKLHLAQKDSRQNEERSSTPSSDTKKDNGDNSHNQQLALALPHQVAPTPVPQPVAPQPQMAPQAQAYYLPSTQVPQSQYPPPDSHYQTQTAPARQSQVSQPPQPQAQYTQQWSQVVQPQQPSTHSGVRPTSPQVYPSYLPSQQVNPSTPEPLPNSMPMPMQMQMQTQMPVPYSSQAIAYGGPGRSAQPPPPPPQPQHLKPAFGGQPSEGYVGGGPHSNVPQGNAYIMYEGYPPNAQQTSVMARPQQQLMRGHPYNELIDRLMSMGYRGDHVMSVIQRLEESGQTVDFNAVLDRLNAHPSGGSQRPWSG